MATLPHPPNHVVHDTLGYRVWQGRMGLMSRAHSHSDFELNLIVTGHAEYLMGGQYHRIEPGRLVILWGGQPHQLVDLAPTTTCIWATLPLARVMQWRLNDVFLKRLLAGGLVQEPDASAAQLLSDRHALTRWCALWSANDAEPRRIVHLEVEARVRRLALSFTQETGDARPHADDGRDDNSGDDSPAPPPRKPQATTRPSATNPALPRLEPDVPVTQRGSLVERTTAFLAAHHAAALDAGAIGRAVGLHPNYLMQLFKQQTGMALWDYVLRLRVAHAQRLLMTSDRTVLDIAMASGFGSASRFHAAFKRIVGQSPAQYRRTLRD